MLIGNLTQYGGEEEWEKLKELNEHFKNTKDCLQGEGRHLVCLSCENLRPI